MATEAAIGTRIKRARERLRWTQRQLADAVRVDRKTVDNWENDRAYPRSSIGALEEVLGVSLSDEGEPRARAISPELRRLIAETLPDEVDQRRVIGLLEGTVTWPDPGNGSPARQPGEDAAPGNPPAAG